MDKISTYFNKLIDTQFQKWALNALVSLECDQGTVDLGRFNSRVDNIIDVNPNAGVNIMVSLLKKDPIKSNFLNTGGVNAMKNLQLEIAKKLKLFLTENSLTADAPSRDVRTHLKALIVLNDFARSYTNGLEAISPFGSEPLTETLITYGRQLQDRISNFSLYRILRTDITTRKFVTSPTPI